MSGRVILVAASQVADIYRELRASTRWQLRLLSAEAQASVVGEFASRFVEDVSVDFWWTSLKVPTSAHYYGNDPSKELISRHVRDWGACYLIATDESPHPRFVLELEASEIGDVLDGFRFFEFALVSRDFSRFVFETHMKGFRSFPSD